MNALALVAWTLLGVQTPEPAPPHASPHAPRLPLRVVTPLAADDAATLQHWWESHAQALGATARVDSVASLGPAVLLPDTLLFGFEAGLLEEIGGDGALLADAADVAAAVHPVGVEAWTIAWVSRRDDDLPELDSYRLLLDERVRRRVRLRRVTRDGPEGLVLSEIRARLQVDLETMLLASDAAGTLLASDLPLDELLRTLPDGAVTLAPARAVVKARRGGRALSLATPREGRVGLTLAAAVTNHSSAATDEILHALVAPPLRDDLCRALELDPVGSPDTILRARAGIERARLADLQGEPQAGGASDGAQADGDWLEDLLDGALVTGGAIVAFFAIRAVRRTPR